MHIGNAWHRLVTSGANEHCAWLACVDLLLRIAGTLCHIPSAMCLRLKATSLCFAMLMASFRRTEDLGPRRVCALFAYGTEQY